MKILHFASITKDKANGVCVAVPCHVIAQSSHADVKFCNVRNDIIDEIKDLQFIKEHDKDELYYINKFKPDVVVFHEAYRPIYLKIAYFLRKIKIPYIIIPHGELQKDAQKKKRLKKILANILLFNKFINNSLVLQCLSIRELETTKFKAKKIIGTNGAILPLKTKQTFDKNKIIYIGRLDLYHKGLDLLCEACGEIKDYLIKKQIKILIYGPEGNKQKKKLEDLINKLGIEDILKINDPVFGEEKERLLLGCKFFIQTSRLEGMPVGILEALSYGVPCVVTEGTTLDSAINSFNAGWVAKTNVDSISNTIKTAIEEEDKYFEKSKNARKLIENDFNWDKIAKSTIEKYLKLLNN